MKIAKTLSFMGRNPIPFIVYCLCWFLYAVFSFATTEPDFSRNTWSGLVWLAKTSLNNLPGSLENLSIILSTIFDEVVKQVLKNEGWFFILLPSFIIGYREAKGNLKGIAKERKLWMHWYDQQNENTLEAPPSSSENKQADSYVRRAQRTVLCMLRNPMHFIRHLAGWLSIFALLFIVFGPPWSDIGEAAHTFVNGFPIVAMYSAILAFLTCYQETRGTVKGIATENGTWTRWYQRQTHAVTQGYPLAAPPPSPNIT